MRISVANSTLGECVGDEEAIRILAESKEICMEFHTRLVPYAKAFRDSI